MKSSLFVLFGLMMLFSNNMNSLNAQETFPAIPSTPVVAHRGFSAICPENTISAFVAAVKSGAQGCECDVRRTSDGVLVISHDSSLKRAAGVDKKINELTFRQLQQYEPTKSKKEFEGKFQGERVPTLESYLLVLKGTTCRPIIEVKEDGFEKEVVDMIRKHKMEKIAVIIDFNEKRVKKYREYGPEICSAWLCSYKKNEMTPKQMADLIIKTTQMCKTNVIDIAYSSLSSELLESLKKAGLHVWCWTVDHPNDIQQMIKWKIESITTNRPDLVLNALKK